MTDPWLVQGTAIDQNNFVSIEIQNKNCEKFVTGFEDDFIPQKKNSENSIDPNPDPVKSLPDSKQYLAILERKLNKIKRDPNIIEQLSKKREECLRNLLNNSLNLDIENDIALDAPISSNDSTVHEIYRHIQPVQPLNIGETLHIVKYDQLEAERNCTSSPLDPASQMGRIMDSQFGEAFLFLTDLAWKCRITLPVLVTAAFMVMDIRLQIEINIQTRQIAADIDDLDGLSDGSDDDSWETLDSDQDEDEDEGEEEEVEEETEVQII